MWAVLTLLVAVDMYILAREDIVRHRADRVANAQQVERVCCADGSGPDEATVTWAELREGDVVRVRDKQFIPADMLLLRGSDRPAEVYVKTQSLDGETDAKMRLAPKLAASRLAQSKCGAPELRAVLRGHVRCEAPDDKVNDFTGQLVLESAEDGQTERCVVSEENLMLRGSQLVHTKWALGVVVACGMDSKIEFGRAKGSEATKTGHTTALMNRDIYAMVAWLSRRRPRRALRAGPPPSQLHAQTLREMDAGGDHPLRARRVYPHVRARRAVTGCTIHRRPGILRSFVLLHDSHMLRHESATRARNVLLDVDGAPRRVGNARAV